MSARPASDEHAAPWVRNDSFAMHSEGSHTTHALAFRFRTRRLPDCPVLERSPSAASRHLRSSSVRRSLSRVRLVRAAILETASLPVLGEFPAPTCATNHQRLRASPKLLP